jgi:hypothetical protein
MGVALGGSGLKMPEDLVMPWSAKRVGTALLRRSLSFVHLRQELALMDLCA